MERIEEITLTVTLKNCKRADGTGGIMHMKIADSCARLMDGDVKALAKAGNSSTSVQLLTNAQ